MHVILTGATGLVGSATLHAMLRDPAISHIYIITRALVTQALDSDAARQKCTVFMHTDFTDPPEPKILKQIQSARACVWALGASTNAVDKQTYEDITIHWPVKWARAFIQAGVGEQQTQDTARYFNFVYISGEGATLQPGWTTPRYARVKGQAEKQLFDLSGQEGMESLQVFAARPGSVDRAGHSEIAGYVEGREGLQKKLEKPVQAVLRPLWKNLMSPTVALGQAIVLLGERNGEPIEEGPGISGEGRIVGNVALRKMAGLQ